MTRTHVAAGGGGGAFLRKFTESTTEQRWRLRTRQYSICSSSWQRAASDKERYIAVAVREKEAANKTRQKEHRGTLLHNAIDRHIEVRTKRNDDILFSRKRVCAHLLCD